MGKVDDYMREHGLSRAQAYRRMKAGAVPEQTVEKVVKVSQGGALQGVVSQQEFDALQEFTAGMYHGFTEDIARLSQRVAVLERTRPTFDLPSPSMPKNQSETLGPKCAKGELPRRV